MILNQLFEDIVASFDKLWKYKIRGNSLEIITPYVTTTQKFVSVFLTEKDGEFIVSDGGWINSNIYETSLNFEDDIFSRAFFHYYNAFKIKDVLNPNGVKYYYKKAQNTLLLSSIIFDLSNFLAAIISISEIEFADKFEKETKERFQRGANSFIQSIVANANLELGAYLGNNKDIRVSALIRKPKNKLTLIQYVTGSTPSYFFNSITRTNFLFEMAQKSKFGGQIDNKISLIDNLALGYQTNNFNNSIKHLLDNTHSELVNWSEKEGLTQYI